jgi:hypothetical protein
VHRNSKPDYRLSFPSPDRRSPPRTARGRGAHEQNWPN